MKIGANTSSYNEGKDASKGVDCDYASYLYIMILLNHRPSAFIRLIFSTIISVFYNFYSMTTVRPQQSPDGLPTVVVQCQRKDGFHMELYSAVTFCGPWHEKVYLAAIGRYN